MSKYGYKATKSIFSTAEARTKSRELASNPEVIWKRGVVKRVFNTPQELSNLTVDSVSLPNVSFASGLIQFYPMTEDTPKETADFATPFSRGVNDSIEKDDEIIYITIGKGTNKLTLYQGPINTKNHPSITTSNVVKEMLQTTRRKAAERSEVSAQKMAKEIRAQYHASSNVFNKITKPKNNTLDYPTDVGKPTKSYQENFGWAKELFNSTDLTLEGRKGNSIRLGHNSQFPNIKISNNRLSGQEKLTDGSLIAMTSLGSLKENFPASTAFKLSCDSGENEGKGPEMASGNTEGQFDYEYGKVQPGLEGQEQFNQLIMESDRIILDSQDEDVTVSSNRHINIGAGKNMSITNKGYTVLESKNIYIGNKAKERTQPMVLGTELQKALIEIIDFIGTLAYTAPASGLGPGTPCFSGTTPLAAAISQLKRGLGLDTEFEPSGEPESLEAETPKSTFLSSKHFIEPNQE